MGDLSYKGVSKFAQLLDVISLEYKNTENCYLSHKKHHPLIIYLYLIYVVFVCIIFYLQIFRTHLCII